MNFFNLKKITSDCCVKIKATEEAFGGWSTSKNIYIFTKSGTENNRAKWLNNDMGYVIFYNSENKWAFGNQWKTWNGYSSTDIDIECPYIVENWTKQGGMTITNVECLK